MHPPNRLQVDSKEYNKKILFVVSAREYNWDNNRQFTAPSLQPVCQWPLEELQFKTQQHLAVVVATTARNIGRCFPFLVFSNNPHLEATSLLKPSSCFVTLLRSPPIILTKVVFVYSNYIHFSKSLSHWFIEGKFVNVAPHWHWWSQCLQVMFCLKNSETKKS